mmetsp:Transcript_90096/g.238412  ORF Transcript_90096/g.238412 Transcript_90096/m.238412 type:complete len:410 (-) Transcript_90096:1104-2333(-)
MHVGRVHALLLLLWRLQRGRVRCLLGVGVGLVCLRPARHALDPLDDLESASFNVRVLDGLGQRQRLLRHVHCLRLVARRQVHLGHQADGVRLRPRGLDGTEEVHRLVGRFQRVLETSQRHLRLPNAVGRDPHQEPVLHLPRCGQGLLGRLHRPGGVPPERPGLVLPREHLQACGRERHLRGEDVGNHLPPPVLGSLGQLHGALGGRDGLRGLLHLQVRRRHGLQGTRLGGPVAQLLEQLLGLQRRGERHAGLPLLGALAARQAHLRDHHERGGLARRVPGLQEEPLRLPSGRERLVQALRGERHCLAPRLRDLEAGDALAHPVAHALAHRALLLAQPDGLLQLPGQLPHGSQGVQHRDQLAVVAGILQEGLGLLEHVHRPAGVLGAHVQLEDGVEHLRLPRLVVQLARE